MGRELQDEANEGRGVLNGQSVGCPAPTLVETPLRSAQKKDTWGASGAHPHPQLQQWNDCNSKHPRATRTASEQTKLTVGSGAPRYSTYLVGNLPICPPGKRAERNLSPHLLLV